MKAENVRTLLEQHSELTDPMRSGNGGSDTGMRLMPHARHCAFTKSWPPAPCDCHLRDYVELDRLLEAMRVDRATPLTPIGVERVSLRALRWHVIHRYLRVATSAKTVRFLNGRTVGIVERPDVPTSRVTPLSDHQDVLIKPAGWETHLAEQRHKRSKNARDARVLVASWHHDVRLPMVDAGIVWIASNWVSVRRPEVLEEAAA